MLPTHTEHRILEAAKTVFIEKGADGTTMQMIAREAGIHKSLLHYYFRTKEKLFDAVFIYAFQNFVPQMEDLLHTQYPVTVKIERIVSSYIDLLMANKFIPAFILHEINRNPDRIFSLMKASGIKPASFMEEFVKEGMKGNIIMSDPRHVIINILALCIFPFAARPLFQRIFFNNNEEAYMDFMEERKKMVTKCIIQSLKP
jgi:AcrR family transcriptional regulator